MVNWQEPELLNTAKSEVTSSFSSKGNCQHTLNKSMPNVTPGGIAMLYDHEKVQKTYWKVKKHYFSQNKRASRSLVDIGLQVNISPEGAMKTVADMRRHAVDLSQSMRVLQNEHGKLKQLLVQLEDRVEALVRRNDEQKQRIDSESDRNKGLQEEINALKKKLAQAKWEHRQLRSSAAAGEIREAFIKEDKENTEKRLRISQEAYEELKRRYTDLCRDSEEYKSMYRDLKVKSSEVLGQYLGQLNDSIQEKRQLVKALSGNEAGISKKFKEMLKTTQQQLRLTQEKNRLIDQVSVLSTENDLQDLHIAQLQKDTRKLARLLQMCQSRDADTSDTETADDPGVYGISKLSRTMYGDDLRHSFLIGHRHSEPAIVSHARSSRQRSCSPNDLRSSHTEALCGKPDGLLKIAELKPTVDVSSTKVAEDGSESRSGLRINGGGGAAGAVCVAAAAAVANTSDDSRPTTCREARIDGLAEKVMAMGNKNSEKFVPDNSNVQHLANNIKYPTGEKTTELLGLATTSKLQKKIHVPKGHRPPVNGIEASPSPTGTSLSRVANNTKTK